MELLGYVSSAFMGVVLGLIGGGGSILTVPILVYLFGLTPVAATASSLFVVGTAAMTGALRLANSGQLRFQESLFFAIPSIVGVLLARKLILPLVPAHVLEVSGFSITKDILLMILFATLMLLASLKMLQGASEAALKQASVSTSKAPSLAVRGLLVGLVTGFIGAGGGFLIVPALVFLLGFKMAEAVGTSLMIIAVNSLVGFIGSLGADTLHWQILLPMTALAILGLFFGSKLQKNFSEGQLKKSFGWFVLIVGGLILLDQILTMKV